MRDHSNLLEYLDSPVFAQQLNEADIDIEGEKALQQRNFYEISTALRYVQTNRTYSGLEIRTDARDLKIHKGETGFSDVYTNEHSLI